MIYNFNFNPTTKRFINDVEVDMPHIIDYALSLFIAEQLEQRVSTQEPLLEYRIAQDLRNTGSVELTIQEAGYLSGIITGLPIDNLLKGQILEVLNPTL